MSFHSILFYILIPVLIAGIITPYVTKWILKKQKNRRYKILKDNGRLDLIDEIQYRRTKAKSKKEEK